MKLSRIVCSLAMAAAASFAVCTVSNAATVLFEDNFDADNSANWTVLDGSGNGTPDFTVDWAFDYGNTSYTSNSVSFKIPPAPNSNGSSKGVKVTVNKNDDVADAAAVNLYPKGKTFSGNYALRFDLWINYNGGEYGGTGSTEFAIFGLNHTASEVNWDAPAGVLSQSDGVWFAVTGEAGAARDFRNYEGDAAGSPLEMKDLSGGFIDRDNSGTPEQEVIDLDTDGPDFPLNLLFPRPPFETTGVPGKRWVQVEVRQRNGTITWLIDGYVIAEKTAQIWTQSEGDIMIGTMDIFASVAAPKADNFVIFDNLRVVDLAEESPAARLTLEATQATAAEPGTSGQFTITRTGDTSQPLNVALWVAGTAQNGTDYAQIPATTNFAAGASSLVIPVQVINDDLGEATETVRVSLLGSPGQYEVFAPMVGKVQIADDGDVTTVSVSPSDPWAYEKIPSDTASFKVTRVGDTSAGLTVQFTLGGTAVMGTDYVTPGSTVIIPAGEDSAFVKIVPTNNAAINTDRSVTLTLGLANGYALGAQTNATVTIRNDDIAPGALLFTDNFDNDSTAQWRLNEANAGQNAADFHFNYSTVGIPPAPNTTNNSTFGLKLQANVGDTPTFTGLSVSPNGKGFEGDYRLSFDMWINYNGPLDVGGAGSTLAFSAGLGTSGLTPQFPGTSVEGVLFAVTGEGGSSIDWRAYVATGAPLDPASGAYAAGTQAGARNNNDPYYAPFGGVTAPEAQLAIDGGQTGVSAIGAPGEAWHEVTITKTGTNVVWAVDNLRIATITLTNKEISTNIFVGFFDINAGQNGNPNMSFGLVDNLRVEQLQTVAVSALRITGITRSGQNLQIIFTSTIGTEGVVLQSSEDIGGTYTDETTAQIQPGANGEGTITVPIGSAPHRFFRLAMPLILWQ